MTMLTSTTLKAQAVIVSTPGAIEQIEGYVCGGALLTDDPPRFDLDQPFCVQTDDGPVWVNLPWACDIEEA